LLLQVARSASSHLRRPVLLLDLAGVVTPPSEESRLPSLSHTVDDASDLGVHDRFAAEVAPVVGVVDASGPLDLPQLLATLSDFQSRYPLVVVHMAGGPLDERVIDAVDGPLLLREEIEQAGWTALAERPGALEVVVRESPPAADGHFSGRTVVATKAALAGTAPGWSAGREPWASVEWVARHLIRRKVGLALGAGGSKGYAHLGVIGRLQELNVPFDYIAGTSIGSPIAAALAAKMPLLDVKELLDHTFSRALRPTLPIQSFLSSRTLRTELEKIAKGRSFEDLGTPLSIVTVDLLERAEVVLNKGDLAQAMVASMAIRAYSRRCGWAAGNWWTGASEPNPERNGGGDGRGRGHRGEADESRRAPRRPGSAPAHSPSARRQSWTTSRRRSR
jgi:hypothetical protein